MITISGVSGTAQVGAAIGVGADSIVVALYADNAGTPGAFIAFLGTVNDSDVSDGLITLSVSIDLDADTRYWLALIGGTDTQLAWVQAANDGGQGVAGEFWVAFGDDPVSDADGAYQFAILGPQLGISAIGSAGNIELHSASFSGVEATGQVGTGIAESLGEIVVSLYTDDDGVPGSFITILGVVTDDQITDINVVSFNIDSLYLDGFTRYWIVVTGSPQTQIAWVQAATDFGPGVSGEYWISLSTPISDYLLDEDGTYLLLEDGAFIGLQEAVPNALGPSYQFAILDQRIDVVGVGSAGSFALEIDVPLTDVHGIGRAGLVSFAGIFLAEIDDVFAQGRAGQITIEIDIATNGVAGSGAATQIPITGSLIGTSATGQADAPIADVNVAVAIGGNAGIGGAANLQLAGTVIGTSAAASVVNVGSEIDVLAEGASATGVSGEVAEAGSVTIVGVAAEGDAEDLATSIEVAISGAAARGDAEDLATSIEIAISGAAARGDAEDLATSIEVVIGGVAATSAAGSFTDAVAIVLSGAQGTGNAGQPTVSRPSNVTVPITGVAGQGSAGTLQGKKKRLRGGRGGSSKFTPALFSAPERPEETDAEKFARYRKIVDDLLDLPPRDDELPPRQGDETAQPEPDEFIPPFSFLKSLEKGEGVEDLATTETVPIDQWRSLAEQEDRLLLGDVMTDARSEDDLLISDLLEDDFYS